MGLGSIRLLVALLAAACGMPAPPEQHSVIVPMAMDDDPPEYTDEARIAELEGAVQVRAVVGIEGRAREVKVTRPLGLGLDEKAAEAVRKWRFWPGVYDGTETEMPVDLGVDFILPEKHSRWHLVGITFRSQEGASRPTVRVATYPPGPGISKASADLGRLVLAMGRLAVVTLSFEIDEHGRPGQFIVDSASDDHWGPEAISVVRAWQFHPSEQSGQRIRAHCT